MGVEIRISGLWDEGYVIDNYVVKSTYIGNDAFGNAQFDTVYTLIGKLLHSMKYNGHFNTSEMIVDMCAKFLIQWLDDKKVDAILPVPPTNYRIMQPVYVIAEAISAKLHIPYSEKVLEKIGTIQAKNMSKVDKHLKGTIIQLTPAIRKCNILLVDDIYSTGSTANECVSVLRNDPLIDKIYFLAIAKTK